MWKENNSDFTQIFKDMKKYAYRPFSTGERATIDPRTYFILREYLNSIAEEHYPVACVPTWDLSIGEQTKTFHYKRLPYNVNNIEIAIGANILYGITSAIVTQLADPHEWFDDDLQMIYENTLYGRLKETIPANLTLLDSIIPASTPSTGLLHVF